MTGQEHYEEAEKCMSTAELAAANDDHAAVQLLMSQAQVHATLALATATAWPGWAARP